MECVQDHTAVSPMGCDRGLSDSLALGSRNQVWNPSASTQSPGVPSKLAGQARAGADTWGQRHLAAPQARATIGPESLLGQRGVIQRVPGPWLIL